MIKRAVICIGVNSVVGMDPLNHAATGARSFAQWASEQGCDVELFVDDAPRAGGREQVLRRDILAAITKIVADSVYAQLIIYFGGHGILKAPGVEIWLLSDAGNDKSEGISILLETENARFSGIPHVVFISDACRVRTADPRLLRVEGGDTISSWDAPWEEDDSVVDIFFATKAGNPAYERPAGDDADGGIFTECFLNLVTTPEPGMIDQIEVPPLSVITINKLGPVLKQQVAAAVERLDPNSYQRPQIRPESELPQFIATVPSKAKSGPSTPGIGPQLPKSEKPSGGTFRPIPTGTGQRRRQRMLDAPFLTSTDLHAAYNRDDGSAVNLARANAQMRNVAHELLAAHADGAAVISVAGGFLRDAFSPGFETVPDGGYRGWDHIDWVALLPRSESAFHKPASALLTLDGLPHADFGAIVPIRVGAATLVTVTDSEVVSVQQTDFRPLPVDVEDDIQQYSAVAFDRALNGDLQFMLEHRTEPRLSEFLESSPEQLDLDVLRGYALAEAGLFDPNLFTRALTRSQVPFDLAMLALRPRTARALDGSIRHELLKDDGRITPFAPQFTRGWLLLGPDNPLYRPVHAELRGHLVPALSTTFNPVGTQIAVSTHLEGVWA